MKKIRCHGTSACRYICSRLLVVSILSALFHAHQLYSQPFRLCPPSLSLWFRIIFEMDHSPFPFRTLAITVTCSRALSANILVPEALLQFTADPFFYVNSSWRLGPMIVFWMRKLPAGSPNFIRVKRLKIFSPCPHE
jgi:hypothetical protein